MVRTFRGPEMFRTVAPSVVRARQRGVAAGSATLGRVGDPMTIRLPRPHPPVSPARGDVTALPLMRRAFPVRERRGGPRDLPCFHHCDDRVRSLHPLTLMPAIGVQQIVKRFRDFIAVGGISITVNEAEIFGLLGPNGAGRMMPHPVGRRTTEATLDVFSSRHVSRLALRLSRAPQPSLRGWRGARGY